jgi:hypothetical protein
MSFNNIIDAANSIKTFSRVRNESKPDVSQAFSSPSSGMMWGETGDSHIEIFLTSALMTAHSGLA